MSIFQAKEIEVIDRQTSTGIFVNNGERRTRRRRAAAQAGYKSFHKLSLARAEIASQRQDRPSVNIAGKLPTDRFRFGRAI